MEIVAQDTSLKRDIEQYYNLNGAQKVNAKHLAHLNERIKSALVAQAFQEASEVGELPPTITLELDNYRAEIDVKRTKSAIDELALEQLLIDKNLWGEATKRVVDLDAVEQLYLQDKLTDSDMRQIGALGKVTLALRVEKMNNV